MVKDLSGLRFFRLPAYVRFVLGISLLKNCLQSRFHNLVYYTGDLVKSATNIFRNLIWVYFREMCYAKQDEKERLI